MPVVRLVELVFKHLAIRLEVTGSLLSGNLVVGTVASEEAGEGWMEGMPVRSGFRLECGRGREKGTTARRP